MKRTTVSLPEDLLSRINDRAKAEGRSQSYVIRRALAEKFPLMELTPFTALPPVPGCKCPGCYWLRNQAMSLSDLRPGDPLHKTILDVLNEKHLPDFKVEDS